MSERGAPEPISRPLYYVLVGQTPVPEPNIERWALAFEQCDRIVAQAEVGSSMISTVFLGIDHSFIDDGPPILFETMTFSDSESADCERCSTWLEAEAQHARIVAQVRSKFKRTPRA